MLYFGKALQSESWRAYSVVPLFRLTSVFPGDAMSVEYRKLKFVTLFSEQSDALVQRIFACGALRKYPKGYVVVKEDEPADRMFFVVAGELEISREHPVNGKRLVFSNISAGEYFGEFGLIDQGFRSADVIAASDSEVFIIGNREFLSIMEGHFKITLMIMSNLTRTIRRMNNKLTRFVFLDVENRIVQHFREIGENTLYGVTIHNPPKIGHLASVIGATREMTGKILKRMQDKQVLIKTDQGFLLKVGEG